MRRTTPMQTPTHRTPSTSRESKPSQKEHPWTPDSVLPADDPAGSLRELLGLSKLFLILCCFAGPRPSETNQGVMTMISSALLNLIVSTVAVGLLVTVLRVAYLMAGTRIEETADNAQVDTPFDLERAA